MKESQNPAEWAISVLPISDEDFHRRATALLLSMDDAQFNTITTRMVKETLETSLDLVEIIQKQAVGNRDQAIWVYMVIIVASLDALSNGDQIQGKLSILSSFSGLEDRLTKSPGMAIITSLIEL